MARYEPGASIGAWQFSPLTQRVNSASPTNRPVHGVCVWCACVVCACGEVCVWCICGVCMCMWCMCACWCVCGESVWQDRGAMAQSAPRSPSKGEIMGSIPIGAILLFLLVDPGLLILPTHFLSLNYNSPPLVLWPHVACSTGTLILSAFMLAVGVPSSLQHNEATPASATAKPADRNASFFSRAQYNTGA